MIEPLCVPDRVMGNQQAFAVYALVANGNWRSPALARRVAGKDRTGQGSTSAASKKPSRQPSRAPARLTGSACVWFVMADLRSSMVSCDAPHRGGQCKALSRSAASLL